METLILILHVLAAIAVIGLVLLQHGKGADMGAAFGSGSSGSLFGSSGSANFLSRATGILAAVFFVTSLVLTYLATHKSQSQGVMESEKAAAKVGVPPDQIPAPGAMSPVPTPAPTDPASKANDIPGK